ncbi:MAG: FHA domain-containing protein [Gammaproteobacteria bacterium]
MSYLNVYFNDELKSKHELNSLITRIGRNRDNDIVIENAGVSGNHAEIIKNDDRYRIYDLNSKNGVFVNGERIGDKEIRFGDEIVIFKHKLRFVAVDLPASVETITAKTTREKGNHSASATVEVDVSKLESLLKESIEKTAYLTVSTGPLAGRVFQLAKPRFSFGKTRDCDFRVGGWFAPNLAAKIVRQSDGYYLAPEKRGRVKLNGRPIKNRTKLDNGTVIEVRGSSFHFRY